MIREIKKTFVETSADFRIYLDDSDFYAPFPKTDIDGTPRKMADLIGREIENLQKWGWTLYDIEEANVIRAWKEI